jgi:hypothetical protein
VTCLAGFVVLGFGLLTASSVPAETAHRYQSDAYGYSIAIPDGWERVPRDVVEQHFPGATRERTPYVYDVVFDEPDTPRFRGAYIVVQVTPYEALLEDGQSQMRGQDIRALLERKAERSVVRRAEDKRTVSEAVDNAAQSKGISHYDPATQTYAMAMDVPVRDFRTVRGQIYGWFGEDSLVEVTIFVPSDQWSAYRALYIDTAQSFAFDDGAVYQPNVWHELPPQVLWGVVALLVLSALVAAGVLLRAGAEQ